MKLLMALTGSLFVLFVLMHMYGNLKVFAGQEAFDSYAHHLRTLGEPILPYSGFLWIFRIVLVLSVIGHAYSAFYLWSKAHNARSTRYAVRAAGAAAWRTQTMRWGGVALIAFLTWHLMHFTTNKINVNSAVSDATIGDSPYQLVVASFQVWWITVFYLAALVAVGLHLQHGVWSAVQTLGWAGTPGARRISQLLGNAVALVVSIGFALPPLFIMFGFVK